jgi:hypothetical protein
LQTDISVAEIISAANIYYKFGGGRLTPNILRRFFSAMIFGGGAG